MKTILLFFIIFSSYCNLFAQRNPISVSADELYNYLKGQDNLFETFSHFNRYNIRKKKSVSDTITEFKDVKNAYYNDSLKDLLLDLYLDSVGWAKYAADKYMYSEKRDYKNDSSSYIYGQIKPYLRGLKIKNVDSILSSPLLYACYLDSFWTHITQRVFEQDIRDAYRYFIPNELIDLIGKIRYAEIYQKFYYEWKRECVFENRYVTNSSYYYALVKYQCPEIIRPKINSDSSISQEVAYYAAMSNNSESYKLMMELIDNTEFVFDGVNNDIPINMFLLGAANNNWASHYGQDYNWELIGLFPGIFKSDSDREFGRIVWSVSIYENEDLNLHYYLSENPNIQVFRKEELLKLSQKNILPYVDFLRLFIKKRYDAAIEEELYWRQNMPYYKTEK